MASSTAAQGVTLHIDFHVHPESRDSFVQHLTEAIQNASREPEFLSSDVLGDPQQPNHITLIENWAKDGQWLREVLFKKQFMLDYHVATKDLLIEAKPRLLRRIGDNVAKAREGAFDKVQWPGI